MELLRKYNTGTTIYFPLITAGSADFITTAVHASGDTQIIKDGGAAANTTNAFAHEGNGIYSLALTSTEMQAAKIQVTVIDQGTKAYSDQAIILATYGNASAEIIFDLSTATQSVNVSQISGDSTAADNAEAFFDGTGYAGTNNVIPTVTTLTNLPAITAGWLTATGIAADAFTAAKFASDVSAEIADAVWDEDATGHQTQGTFGQAIGDPVADTNTIYKAVVTDATGATVGVDVVAIKAETVTIQADTDNIQTRLPAALVSGRMDASVGAMAADVLTAAATAADFGAEIADAVWDEDATGHQTQGTFGQAIGDPGADADTIWSLVNTNLNATISSRASQTSVDTLDDFVDTEIAAIITTLGTPAGASISADIAAIEAQTDDIGAAGAGLSAIPWNSAWDAEVQSEVADALAAFWTSPATLVDLIWDEPTSGHTTAGTTGKALIDAGSAGDPWGTALPGAYGSGTAGFILGTNLDAAVTTRMASYTQPTGFLAATFPGGTIANTTNITAGTITTATNVTTVNGLAANVITAAATAADFTTEIQTGLATQASVDIIDGIVDSILVDTAEIGVAGAGLTNINLPNQTMDIVGNITGNLSGSVGSVTGLTVAHIDAAISTRATPAQVNAEVVDALATDTYTEPTGAPGVTVSLKDKIGYIYMALRNKLTVTSSAKTFYDDGGAAEWSKALSDDGVTYSEDEGA